MSQPLSIIIVEKTGALKLLSVKDFKEDELFKKCGFKKSEDFIEQTEWSVKLSGMNKYYVKVFAKTDGRANNENKYDFPPPIDNKLFFGNCAIIAFVKKSDGTKAFTDLTLPLWEKIYEKLFGGFEDLAVMAVEDNEEEDELKNVPKERKTKQGYLKDGFVVDSSDTDEEDEEDEDDEELSDEIDNNTIEEEENDGSELSEEEYDYSDSVK